MEIKDETFINAGTCLVMASIAINACAIFIAAVVLVLV